ncbi:GNAT family N-acetyltransferase [Ligilactobacillus sp. WILCCON 0076]|uniref:GNAT family N-acetyltransferase n=1 Tax=Ligilactobacillus ubinensis TaxID=2876789 RepID=A0A9X2JLC9_9LACO|nr:GNAT family N-acetyltransferase [Ligilactobacillus ubinensis]MCP0886843.1 GNAT family N-acetyltransferase [Ligilactobacillus ubinensis]
MLVQIKTTTDLNSQVYADAVAIRMEVFVKEQGVDRQLELDFEKGPIYYVGYLADKPVATARVIVQEDNGWHLQRVAILKAFRGQKLGSQILKAIESDARENKVSYLTLGAQDQAQLFYTKLGYQVVGKGFLDANIVHHRMDKKII